MNIKRVGHHSTHRLSGLWIAATLFAVAGTAFGSPFFIQDPDREPSFLFWQVYHPDPDAFEKGWSQIPPDHHWSNNPKQAAAGEWNLIAYRSKKNGRRILAKRAGDKTWVFLMQNEDLKNGADMLFLLHSPEPFTDEKLALCLEHLPLVVQHGFEAEGYPLTKEGAENEKITQRDLYPLAWRLIVPYFRFQETSTVSPTPKTPDLPGIPSNARLPSAPPPEGRGYEAVKIPATGGVMLAHSYAPDALAFEASWRLKSNLIQGGRPGFISWSIAPLNDIRIAYVAENEHHRAICFALDDTHFFIVVRFKDSRQPDLGFYLRTTYEERGPDSASLERMVESLPYFLPSTKRQPDHPLGQDGNIDAKVFMRDFFSALLPLY